VRRWIEVTVALIVSKLILVIIFVVGLDMLVKGVGQAGSGGTQRVTQAVSGLLVLAVAGFSPWLALRLVHWSGDHFHQVHTLASASAAGAQQAVQMPQKALPWVTGGGAGGLAAVGVARTQGAGGEVGLEGPRTGRMGPGTLSSGLLASGETGVSEQYSRGRISGGATDGPLTLPASSADGHSLAGPTDLGLETGPAPTSAGPPASGCPLSPSRFSAQSERGMPATTSEGPASAARWTPTPPWPTSPCKKTDGTRA
jgi:hypothetical protein